jgi:hypothetical protein
MAKRASNGAPPRKKPNRINACNGDAASNDAPSIIDAIADPDLLGAAFKDVGTWSSWFSFLRSLFGLKLSAAELATFKECTERKVPSADGHQEAWLCCGRRSGKSFILALVAVYLAAFRDWKPYLSAGEVGTIMVIATDRRQAQVILGYIRGLLEIPLLSRLVVSDGAESIVLDNRVEITVQTASYKSIRGRTVVGAFLDEAAYFRSEDSANPDTELLRALRPAMATVPGSMLLVASSPYARKGELFKAYEKWFGKDDAKPLVWRAPSLTMNLALDPAIVRDALAEDEAAARAE